MLSRASSALPTPELSRSTTAEPEVVEASPLEFRKRSILPLPLPSFSNLSLSRARKPSASVRFDGERDSASMTNSARSSKSSVWSFSKKSASRVDPLSTLTRTATNADVFIAIKTLTAIVEEQGTQATERERKRDERGASMRVRLRS